MPGPANTATTTSPTTTTTPPPATTPPAPDPAPGKKAKAPPAEVDAIRVTYLGPADPQNLSRAEVTVGGQRWRPNHPTRTVRSFRLVGTNGKPDEKATEEAEAYKGLTLGEVGAVPKFTADKTPNPQAAQPAFKVERIKMPAHVPK